MSTITAVRSNNNNNNNSSDKEGGDNRLLVEELIREHRPLIDQMVATLSSSSSSSPLYDPAKHDDLWCLRFLLSHKKNLDKAIAAAQTTLAFRREHGLDEWGDIRGTAPQDITTTNNNTDDSTAGAAWVAWKRFIDSGGVTDRSIVYAVPDEQRCGVLTFIDIGSMDPHKLAELSVQEWIAALAYMNEWNYQWCDYLTRKTGRLTKSVRLVDVGTASLSQIDWQCQMRYTQAIGTMQDCYPQAVKSIYVCYAPFWVYGPWKAIRPLLPSRVVNKMDFLDPASSSADNADDRQRLLGVAAGCAEYLPRRYGGTNDTILGGSGVGTNNSNG